MCFRYFNSENIRKLKVSYFCLIPYLLCTPILADNNMELDKSSPPSPSKREVLTKEKDDNQAKYRLDSVVTTATGFAQDRKNAPASISVVPKEEILTRPIKDLGDAVQDLPGVFVEATKTGQNQITMRGLGSAYTLILIDGKRQNVNRSFDANGFNGAFSSFMPPVSMIERIEVIRGPASVVYGADAMGGVINIITKKNPQRFTGSVMVETDIQEKREVWGDSYGANTNMSAPIIKDKLSLNVRGAYKYNQANYFRTPTVIASNGNPYSSHSPGRWYSWNAGGRIDYIINPENSIFFDAEYYHITNTTLSTSAQAISATNDFNKTNASINHESTYNWGNMQSYIQFSDTRRIPQITTGFGNVSGPLNYNSMRINQALAASSMYNKDFDFNSWGDLSLTSGIYYYFERLAIRQNNLDRNMHQFAIFAEGQYFITDKFSTTLGLRYNYANLYSTIPNPRFYLNYNPTSWITLKGGIAGGMQIPGLNQSFEGVDVSGGATQTFTYGNKDLRPETSWNTEFSTIFDTDYAYIIATAFYTLFKDQIQSISIANAGIVPIINVMCPSGSTCTIYNNVDKSFTTGFEFSLQTNNFYGFSFDVNYGLTWTGQLSGELKGEPVLSIPRHKIVSKINYKWENLYAYLRFSGNFQTPTLANAGNARTGVRQVLGFFYKDYVLVDLAVSYKLFKQYTFTFSINNLFNHNFVDYIAYQNNSIAYQNAYQRFLPGRNYWFSIRYDF